MDSDYCYTSKTLRFGGNINQITVDLDCLADLHVINRDQLLDTN